MPDGVDEDVETVSVDVADVPEEIGTLIGLKDGVGPEGELPAVKLIVPLNPLTLVKVIVEAVKGPVAP